VHGCRHNARGARRPAGSGRRPRAGSLPQRAGITGRCRSRHSPRARHPGPHACSSDRGGTGHDDRQRGRKEPALGRLQARNAKRCEYWCRKEPVLGSRLAEHKNCGTAEQLRQSVQGDPEPHSGYPAQADQTPPATEPAHHAPRSIKPNRPPERRCCAAGAVAAASPSPAPRSRAPLPCSPAGRRAHCPCPGRCGCPYRHTRRPTFR